MCEMYVLSSLNNLHCGIEFHAARITLVDGEELIVDQLPTNVTCLQIFGIVERAGGTAS